MWPNLQETADFVTFTEKSLMENFIFCAVLTLGWVKALAAKKKKVKNFCVVKNFTTQNDDFPTRKKFPKVTSYLRQNI